MKFFKIFAITALFTGSLLQGYAVVYSYKSVVPLVDIYTFKANSPQEAKVKFILYASTVKVPATLFQILRRFVGYPVLLPLRLLRLPKVCQQKFRKGFTRELI